MASGIINGFNTIIHFIHVLWDLICSIFTAIGTLFSKLPDIIDTCLSIIDYMPDFLIAPATFCLTVTILVRTIHAKAGDG